MTCFKCYKIGPYWISLFQKRISQRGISKKADSEKLGSQKGLTLLEVLIAVIVLSLAASLLVFSSRSSVTGYVRSKIWGDAATATKEAMANLEMLPIDSLSRLSKTPITHSQGSGIQVFATVRGVTPSDVSNFATLDTSTLRYVTLSTQFKNKAGNLVKKEFTTILIKP